jgi:hypothetical protein
MKSLRNAVVMLAPAVWRRRKKRTRMRTCIRSLILTAAVAAVFSLLCFAPAASARDWYIPGDFPYLYEAFSNGVEDGDTIHIGGSVYIGGADVSASVTIVGEGEGATIQGSYIGDRLFVSAGYTVTLENLTVTKSGGIVNWGKLHAIGCTFEGNVNGSGYGGAIQNFGELTAVNCIFTGNSAWRGGAIANLGGTATLTGCTFAGNTASDFGGAVTNISWRDPTVPAVLTATNCTFIGNYAYSGGGIYNAGSNLTATNCTFTQNVASYEGGGICHIPGIPAGSAMVTNSILWGDTGTYGKEIYFGYGGFPIVEYSDVEGGWDDTGDIDADPLFVRNPDLSTGDFGDLRLQPDSPCIDSGDNSVVTADNGFLMDSTNSFIIDLDGNARIVGTAVDMGAFENQEPPAYTVSPLYDQTRAVKAGACYPIKLQLLGTNGTNISSPDIALHATGVTHVFGEAMGELQYTGNANPDYDFRYDASLGGYIFNLKTTGLGNGIWKLSFTIGDDATEYAVEFQVR